MSDDYTVDTDLLTVTQAAASVGVTVQTLGVWWRHGTGPHRIEIGGRVFVSRADLRTWLAKRRTAPSTRPEQPGHLAA